MNPFWRNGNVVVLAFERSQWACRHAFELDEDGHIKPFFNCEWISSFRYHLKKMDTSLQSRVSNESESLLCRLSRSRYGCRDRLPPLELDMTERDPYVTFPWNGTLGVASLLTQYRWCKLVASIMSLFSHHRPGMAFLESHRDGFTFWIIEERWQLSFLSRTLICQRSEVLAVQDVPWPYPAFRLPSAYIIYICSSCNPSIIFADWFWKTLFQEALILHIYSCNDCSSRLSLSLPCWLR